MPAALVTTWFALVPDLATGWIGPDGRIETMLQSRPDGDAVPVVFGPRGERGFTGLPGQAPSRIDASLAATWILPNPLGRIPLVQVYLAGGEQVIADVAADTAHITVTFPSPQQGFVLAF